MSGEHVCDHGRGDWCGRVHGADGVMICDGCSWDADSKTRGFSSAKAEYHHHLAIRARAERAAETAADATQRHARYMAENVSVMDTVRRDVALWVAGVSRLDRRRGA